MKIEIDRLNQEIEELKAENADLKLKLELSQPLYSRRELEAENACYREWLNSISHDENCECGFCGSTIEQFAREALKGE